MKLDEVQTGRNRNEKGGDVEVFEKDQKFLRFFEDPGCYVVQHNPAFDVPGRDQGGDQHLGGGDDHLGSEVQMGSDIREQGCCDGLL